MRCNLSLSFCIPDRTVGQIIPVLVPCLCQKMPSIQSVSVDMVTRPPNQYLISFSGKCVIPLVILWSENMENGHQYLLGIVLSKIIAGRREERQAMWLPTECNLPTGETRTSMVEVVDTYSSSVYRYLEDLATLWNMRYKGRSGWYKRPR